MVLEPVGLSDIGGAFGMMNAEGFLFCIFNLWLNDCLQQQHYNENMAKNRT